MSNQRRDTAPPVLNTPYPRLTLRKREERRLRGGHLWVFSNEVDTRATPLKDFAPGDAVTVVGSSGRFLGHGYVNPRSLIAARILSREPDVLPDEALLSARLRQAVALREGWLGQARWCRLIHGEGDLLPGLVVDRFDELLVGQITTAGMARWQDALGELLREHAPGVRALRWANDTAVRDLEGLARESRMGFGEPPAKLTVKEGDARFELPGAGGQKTGWYYDQRANRERLLPMLREGHRMLDVFSYVGAWGIRAALAGAGPVVCVDSSSPALDAVAHNAALNGVEVKTHQGDAAAVLKALAAQGQRFDVLVLDPPALIPRRKDIEAGTKAYWQLNELAMRLVADDGLLVSCSCSHHLSEESLLGVVAGCARHQRRDLQILMRGEQAPDHPVHPSIEQSRYLKALYCRVGARKNP
ncbi:MAG: class I SAM-dependent rRNA methyltransferase [Pseudomonadota bacterium]